MFLHPLIHFERRLSKLEKLVKKYPDNHKYKYDFNQLKQEYDRYIWNRWH